MTSFSDFGLADSLTRAVRDAGYETPTPIQEQAIPLLLEGHDLLGIALEAIICHEIQPDFQLTLRLREVAAAGIGLAQPVQDVLPLIFF